MKENTEYGPPSLVKTRSPSFRQFMSASNMSEDDFGVLMRHVNANIVKLWA